MDRCSVCGFKIDEYEGDPGRKAFRCEACGALVCGDHAAPLYNCVREQPKWLCPTHYQQVKDYIEGLKQCGCGIRCPECGVWAVKVDVSVRGFKCSSCGEQYPSLSNIDGLKPVFPKMAQSRGRRTPIQRGLPPDCGRT